MDFRQKIISLLEKKTGLSAAEISDLLLKNVAVRAALKNTNAFTHIIKIFQELIL